MAACFTPRPTEIPIPTRFYESGNGEKKYLVVFLPGRGDDIDGYERGVFIDVLKNSKRPLDAVVVDAHFGYYNDRSLGERVHEDVLVPYRQRGYKKFILAGISLGGVGALKISNDYPDLIDGTVLIAPFLGGKSTYQSVGAFGNIHEWRQQLEDPPLLDEEIWTWIDTMYDVDSGLVACTILTYGRRDSFSAASDVLAKMLPESHVFTGDGGHKWIVWQPL